MNQLVWRGETVNGKYLGEVALLTELSPVVHCESFVDGNWRLWSYMDDREQVLQQGKATNLKEAQYICEQTALALQGIQGSQNASDVPMQPMMPVFMPIMPNMYTQQPQQAAYENSYEHVDMQPSSSLQELRFKFRRWAISLTLMGCIFLSIWYSMMLKPVSTISLLLVLTSIIWGAQAVIKSFKRPRSSASPPSSYMDDGITIFSTSQVKPSRRQVRPQPQLASQFRANQLMANQFSAGQPMALMNINNPLQNSLPTTQQALVHVMPQGLPQLQAPQTVQPLQSMQPLQPTQTLQPMQAIQQQAQATFYNPAMHMQSYHRSNG